MYKQNVCINILCLVLNPTYKVLLSYGNNGHIYVSATGEVLKLVVPTWPLFGGSIVYHQRRIIQKKDNCFKNMIVVSTLVVYNRTSE